MNYMYIIGISFGAIINIFTEVPYEKPIRGVLNGTIQLGDLYKSSPPANATVVRYGGLTLHAKPSGGGKFCYSKNGAVFRIQ